MVLFVLQVLVIVHRPVVELLGVEQGLVGEACWGEQEDVVDQTTSCFDQRTHLPAVNFFRLKEVYQECLIVVGPDCCCVEVLEGA